MNDTHDRLEILIGRFLDGELSPREQSLLESELGRDSRAKELFEQMRILHECSCGVVTHEVLGRGSDPAEIFERAWQQNQRSFWRRVVRGGLERDAWHGTARFRGHLRFAAGMAAGFLLGLVLQFVPAPHSSIPSHESSRPPVALDVPPDGYGPAEVTPVRSSADSRQVTRVVDWYVYTDRAGNRWLIEGTHEGMVKPAVYRNGL